MIEEAKDIQAQLDDQTQQTIGLDRKLNYARKMLESERKARRDAEAEKDQFELKLDSLRTLLLNDHTMKDETRKHLQVLSSLARKRKSTQYYEEEPCENINSTGSILSDLSLTQSGDDLLDPKPTTQVKWKKHRPSLNNSGILNISNSRKSRQSAEKRRSARRSVIEIGPNDKIITQTKFTIPMNKRAAICAESLIEAISNPTVTSSSSEEVVMITKTPSRKKAAAPEPPTSKTPSHLYPNIVKAFETPSAPSIDELDRIDSYQYNNFEKKRPVEKTPTSSAISVRAHTFSSKTFLKPETCGGCKKKIKFGSTGFRCSECRTCVHQDCKDRFSSTVSCFPQKSTPISKSGLGTISDYTPLVAPMIPALIVHCVNEIEMRGLTEVGLYRISGSDRDVKALKEKFLKSNGIPNIADCDVHVLCGCVKDFLRSLKERLIPMRMWMEFSNAAQTAPIDDDETSGNRAVIHAVEMLPQPNRDTLAFIIMHFQRISECPEVKMPLTNFAKIFGPTIVGYSTHDPDTHAMFAETQIQFSVMFALLTIPTEYWGKFIRLDQLTKDEEQKEIATYGSKFYSGTPSLKIMRKEKKFYDTPPYSAISKKRK